MILAGSLSMKKAWLVRDCAQRTSFSLALAIALIVISGFAIAQSSNPRIKSNLQALKSDQASERVAAAKSLIEDWQNSFAVLIPELSAYNREVPKLSQKELQNFLAITDVLRSIVINKDKEGAIKAFRDQDDDQTIRSLVWAARSDDKDLRINATYILASVVDNTNLCIVLHHLQDKKISADGRINLLQVASAVAGYAYHENVLAITETIGKVQEHVEDEKDVGQTRALLKDLLQRCDKSINKKQELPPALAKYCKDYPYKEPLTQ
jgi:hypothetical protein